MKWMHLGWALVWSADWPRRRRGRSDPTTARDGMSNRWSSGPAPRLIIRPDLLPMGVATPRLGWPTIVRPMHRASWRSRAIGSGRIWAAARSGGCGNRPARCPWCAEFVRGDHPLVGEPGTSRGSEPDKASGGVYASAVESSQPAAAAGGSDEKDPCSGGLLQGDRGCAGGRGENGLGLGRRNNPAACGRT